MSYRYCGTLASEVPGSQTTTYTNDGQDQLIGVLPHSGVLSTYTFDGDGMRRSAQEGNVQPTTMVWDGSDYLFLDGPSADSLVLTLDGEIVACGSKDLLTDPLGTLLREISAGATLSGAFGFYPYGSPVLPMFSPPTIPFRYIAAYGYFFDTNDRDYVRARELEKRLGRWMQTDPLWPDERAFGYVGGSVVLYTDRSGLQRDRDAVIRGWAKDVFSWWSEGSREEYNNCFNYGCDVPSVPPKIRVVFPSWENYPGGQDCLCWKPDDKSDLCKCRKVMDCLMSDVRLKSRIRERAPGRKCPSGTFTVILFVKSTPVCDFHFIRSLPNGKWCDKHGQLDVCVPFDNPYEHARRAGYGPPCQHYCVAERPGR